MLDKKTAKLINEQVTLEFYSAYLYLDFANFYTDQGLAMLMRTYLQNNNVHVEFGTINKPEGKYKDLMSPLTAALEHEQFITKSINKIYGAAHEEDDYRTMQFFNWFVKEQGEEEKNVDDIIKKMKLFGSDPKSLYALNQDLLARVYAAPTLVL